MLTGDKLETAESIGYSSKLLTSQTDIIRIRNELDV
jgi:magnesium-transporting ATPase (P-type)